MPEQIASGGSAAFALDSNDTFSVTGSCRVMVNPSRSGVTSVDTTQSGTASYGPYVGGASVRLSATGAVDFTVTRPPFERNVTIDQDTNTLSPSAQEAVALAANVVIGNYLGVLGDSISARWLNNSDASNAYTQPFGYIKWALELSGCFLRAKTAATPSTGCTAASASFKPTFQTQAETIIAERVTHCVVMGGVNDIQADASLADIQAAMLPIIDKLIAAGIRVYWCTIPPMSSTYGNYTTARQSVLLAYNDWVRRQCAQYGKRVRLVDLYRVIVDPASKTSSMLSSATSDKLHPINYGAYYMGKELAAAWKSDGVPTLPLLIGSAGDAQVDETGAALFSGSTNILQNGLFNLGTPASGVAQNWTQTATGATCTSTVVAAPSGIGSAQQLACTFTASGQSVQLTSTNFASRMSLSGSALVSLGIKVDSPANLKNVRVRVRGFGNINTSYVWSLSDATDTALPEGWTGTIMFVLPMPAGLTALGGGMTLDVLVESAGAGSANVQVYQASVRSLATGA